MAEFRPYMHVEKYGNDEVRGIELGKLFIFPKLDGTNASVWSVPDGDSKWRYQCGSRTRTLSRESDNAGFLATCEESEGDGLGFKLLTFVNRYPNLRLYGEWLVPHTLKTYRDDVWRRFWVFDVFNDETNTYLNYETYQPLLDGCGLDYMPPLATIKGGDYEYFIHVLNQNVFGIKDGQGVGEGVVLKNYEFVNEFGNTVWAKIIQNEFKEQHHRLMGSPETERKIVEEEIANVYITESLCTKTYAKIVNEKQGWTSKYIPELLGRVFHDLITEELWQVIKTEKSITINFGMLKHFTIARIKSILPHLF